jgi:hypothetical protein
MGERTADAEQDFAGTPRPDAMLPVLDEGQLEALRQVGASGTGRPLHLAHG